MCRFPLPIKYENPWLKSNYLLVPCGSCLECREKRKDEWAFRLYQESLVSKSVFFVTLTYDDEHVPIVGQSMSVSRSDIQKYHKRLAKRLKVVGIKMRYFLISPYLSIKA